MTVRETARSLYRGHAHRYPRLYEAQQRAQVRARTALRRVHEPEFAVLADLRLPPRPLCVDIGANQGQSIVSLKRVLPDARIESFEPNPDLLALAQRTARRYDGVRCHPFGLDATAGQVTLHTPSCRGLRFPQLATIEPPSPEQLSLAQRAAGFTWATPDVVTYTSLVVEMRTVDELDLAPDVIKIDVEGAESRVLAGANRTVREHLPVLIVERNETATAPLLDLGYSVLPVPGGHNTLLVQPRHLA